jgi:plasmid stability protein
MMNIRFDDNDDLVLDNIPDDLMRRAGTMAADRGVSAEDVWRDVMERLARTERQENR